MPILMKFQTGESILNVFPVEYHQPGIGVIKIFRSLLTEMLWYWCSMVRHSYISIVIVKFTTNVVKT